jgi:hypothetical protein
MLVSARAAPSLFLQRVTGDQQKLAAAFRAADNRHVAAIRQLPHNRVLVLAIAIGLDHEHGEDSKASRRPCLK